MESSTPARDTAWAMSDEHEQSARKTYRRAAEAHLDGEVEAAGVFQRSAPMGFSGSLGVLERALDWSNDRIEGRIGRLRRTFLLAVTRDKVHALRYRSGSEGFRIEE